MESDPIPDVCAALDRADLRDRLRALGWVQAEGHSYGYPLWKSPEGDLVDEPHAFGRLAAQDAIPPLGGPRAAPGV